MSPAAWCCRGYFPFRWSQAAGRHWKKQTDKQFAVNEKSSCYLHSISKSTKADARRIVLIYLYTNHFGLTANGNLPRTCILFPNRCRMSLYLLL